MSNVTKDQIAEAAIAWRHGLRKAWINVIVPRPDRWQRLKQAEVDLADLIDRYLAENGKP